MRPAESRRMGLSALSRALPIQWLQENVRLCLRLLIVGGALLGSAYLAPLASQRHLELLAGAGAMLIFLRWPPMGLIALVAAGLVIPFALGTGTETRLNVAVLLVTLLTVLWLLDMIAGRRLRLAASPPIVPLLVFMAASIVAFIAGAQSWLVFAHTASLAAQAGGLSIFILSGCAFLLAAHQIRDLRWLRWLTWAFLAVGAIYVAGRVVPEMAYLTGNLYPTGADGSVFWIWLLALAFSHTLFNRDLAVPWRLALAGLALATLYVGVFPGRDWVSGWIPPLVAAAVALLFAFPRLVPLAIVAAAGLGIANAESLIGFVMIGDNEYSLMTRLEAWRIMAEIISINPILGLGFSNYYWYTPLFPILGYHVVFNSHNNYVDIVAQTGLVGLACFLWFLWATGRVAWRLRAQVAAGFPRAYVIAAMGGLAGMLAAGMLGDWVLPFTYNVGMDGFRASVVGWIFLGGLVALQQLTPGPSVPQDSGLAVARRPGQLAQGSSENSLSLRPRQERPTGMASGLETMSSAEQSHTRTTLAMSPGPAPELSVIIVNWNTRDLLARCLASLLEAPEAGRQTSPTVRPLAIEVLVVDNASSDGSARMVRESFPQVRLWENNENVGFARANNQAIPSSRGRYVLLLNPDTEVHAGALPVLVSFMDEHPRAGGAGARLLNQDGSLYPSFEPAPTLLCELWRLFHLDAFWPHGRYRVNRMDLRRVREVDVVQGACLILRREALDEVGLLDEDYFIYSEEVDLCQRLRLHGWRIYWVPEAIVTHYGGQSTRQLAAAMFLELHRSKVLYFRKNYGQPAAHVYKLILLAAAVVRLILSPLAWLERSPARHHHQALAERYRHLLRVLPGL